MGNQAFANPTLDETSELDVWQLFQKKTSYWMSPGAGFFFHDP